MMAVIASSMVEPASGEETAARSAADVVRAFYDGVNRRDLAAVEPLIAEGCVYEDLVFPNPFVGRAEILGFFAGFMGSVSSDLRFVIDDISAGDDSRAVGVTWHLGTHISLRLANCAIDKIEGIYGFISPIFLSKSMRMIIK
jgi:hypothetical protein